jgi:hypothetical protein
LGKLRLTFRTHYGEISIEGDSLSDFKNTLAEIGISHDNVQSIVNAIISQIEAKDVLVVSVPISVTSSKPELSGVIEYGSDGVPHITIPPDNLTARDVIGLLLYAKSPNAISMGELAKLVINNWKNVDMSQISSNLSQMRAFVIKEGARGSFSYRLSGSGKNWIENELLPKLKMKTQT